MNAIILAAGVGSRLHPVTLNIPKPLIEIDGLAIIERQIVYLKEAGIHDIYIVVGYSRGSFNYLKERYDVELIFNPEFNTFNNLYSLYVSKCFFGDTWIIEGDVYMRRNFFRADIKSSTYLTGFKKKVENEWVLRFGDDFKLKDILTTDDLLFHLDCQNGANIMSGVSFWAVKESRIILELLEMKIKQCIDETQMNIISTYYWDQLVKESLDKLDINIELIDTVDWYEIDTQYDLDQVFQEQNKTVDNFSNE